MSSGMFYAIKLARVKSVRVFAQALELYYAMDCLHWSRQLVVLRYKRGKQLSRENVDANPRTQSYCVASFLCEWHAKITVRQLQLRSMLTPAYWYST